jgi:hypothetical protein
MSLTDQRPRWCEADAAQPRKYVLPYKVLTGQITEGRYRSLIERDW